MTERAQLPRLQAGWAERLLDWPIPAEAAADCAACPKCPQPYSPSTKCCTYLPVLPNFLVGRLLDRASLRDRIDGGGATSPLGLGRPSGYSLADEQTFGRGARVCPHYLADDGTCEIWSDRETVCATWFCMHDRGEVGARFWRSLRELFWVIEDALKRWCVRALLISEAAHHELFSVEVNRDPQEPFAIYARYRRMWGEWMGREAEFYLRCAERVEGLEWEAVAGIVGEALGAPLARLRAMTG